MNEVFEKMKNIMCESCMSIEENLCDGEDKAECQWMQKIAEVATATEAEIRAKAIADFVEHINLPLTTEEDIAKILEQLKAGE